MRPSSAVALSLTLLGLLARPGAASAQHHRRHRRAPAAPPSPAGPPPAAALPSSAGPPPTATPPSVDAAPAPAPAAPPPVSTAPEAPPPVTNVDTAPTESTPWSLRWRTRPLSLPARVVRVDASLGLDRSVVTLGATRVASSSLAPWLRVGAGVGVTNAVELGITTTPLRIEAGAQFRDVAAYARFRFLHGERFDLGAQLSAGYLHPERFAGSFSALLRWRLETLRIDVTPSVELFAGATNVIDLRVPVDLWWQLSQDFTLGLRTGIIAPGFTDSRLGIIVGARAVYSLGRGDAPFMDLFVSFDAEPLIHFSGTIFRDDFVIVQLGAQAHFGP